MPALGCRLDDPRSTTGRLSQSSEPTIRTYAALGSSITPRLWTVPGSFCKAAIHLKRMARSAPGRTCADNPAPCSHGWLLSLGQLHLLLRRLLIGNMSEQVRDGILAGHSFLSSERMTCHGAHGVSVALNISSRALE